MAKRLAGQLSGFTLGSSLANQEQLISLSASMLSNGYLTMDYRFNVEERCLFIRQLLSNG